MASKRASDREEKVGAKHKPSTDVQGWIRPFRYDNIENHVSGQHPSKWMEYKRLDSSDDWKAFFDDVSVSFKNSIKVHFPSSSLGVEREMMFDIAKNIVDVIVGDMMFEANDDDIDSDPDDDMDKPPAFGTVTFRKIQGLSTLLDQHQAALDDIVTSFVDDVGVIGPLSPEAIANFDVSAYVISGRYAFQLSFVREFVSGLAYWADSIVDKVDTNQRSDLWNKIALVYVTACDRVSQLIALRNADNHALANPSSLYLVLSHDLVKLSVAEIIRNARRQTYRLQHCYSVDHIDAIADEHKLLLQAYR
ncbi:hypothetical protein AXG93_4542s1320 [Marchantia polymorpha subsp. ruderalis]|uniref:Uncharacterized protein n=1 Tax=Marchantia polymorpha subsp. ruderalis TaxID=1480154 RepID=A0A176W244_MARPO|nr:hypothetical protein AXG93_4542s1320 [Marchantia polymorpha subsp. ruderalis]